MARVNIELDFLNGSKPIEMAEELKVDENFVLGLCVRLWNFVQTKQRCFINEKEMFAELKVNNRKTKWKHSLIVLLLKHKLITNEDDGYYICGSRERLEWRKKRGEAGRKGNEVRWGKCDRTLREQPHPKRIASFSSTITVSNKHKSTDLCYDAAIADDDDSLPKVRKIFELWNEVMPKPPFAHTRVDLLKSSSKQYEVAKTRLGENPDLNFWREVFERIAKSKFCRREKPSHSGSYFLASIEFALRPDTPRKVLEGKYDDFEMLTETNLSQDFETIKKRNEEKQLQMIAELKEQDRKEREAGRG